MTEKPDTKVRGLGRGKGTLPVGNRAMTGAERQKAWLERQKAAGLRLEWVPKKK